MDMDKLAKQALNGKNNEALAKLTQSGAGQKLAEKVDGAALEKAMKSGDMNTLSAMLGEILASPEGKAFAGQVQKAADGHGR